MDNKPNAKLILKSDKKIPYAKIHESNRNKPDGSAKEFVTVSGSDYFIQEADDKKSKLSKDLAVSGVLVQAPKDNKLVFSHRKLNDVAGGRGDRYAKGDSGTQPKSAFAIKAGDFPALAVNSKKANLKEKIESKEAERGTSEQDDYVSSPQTFHFRDFSDLALNLGQGFNSSCSLTTTPGNFINEGIPTPLSEESAVEMSSEQDVLFGQLSTIESYDGNSSQDSCMVRQPMSSPSGAGPAGLLSDTQTPRKSSLLQCQYGLLGLASSIRAAQGNPDMANLVFGISPYDLNIAVPRRNYFKTIFDANDEQQASQNEAADSKKKDLASHSDEQLLSVIYKGDENVTHSSASVELYRRGWFYYEAENLWMRKSGSPAQHSNDGKIERGLYECFDAIYWRTLIVPREIEMNFIRNEPF